MPGLRLTDLPPPYPEFDPERAPLDDRGRKRFESAEDALREDRTRATLVRRQARKQSPLINGRRAQRLASRLAAGRVCSTPACARYMHDMRRRIVGAVWQLVCDED